MDAGHGTEPRTRLTRTDRPRISDLAAGCRREARTPLLHRPGHALRRGIATGTQVRNNPSGTLSVSNIDFTVLLAQPPR